MQRLDDVRAAAPAMTAEVSELELDGRPVLVASDGTTLAQAAARVAAALERERGAVPTVLNVFDMTGYPVPPLLVEALGVADRVVGDAAHEEQQHKLRTLLSDAVPEAARWPSDIVAGTPSVQIVSHAQQVGAALTVIGLRTHGAIERIARDQTTLGVLRHAAAPAFAVREGALGLPRRIIVGTDFSRASVAAARAALRVAADGARVTLAHVDRADDPEALEEGQKVVREVGIAGALAQIEQYLGQDSGKAHGIVIDTMVLHGRPSEALLDYVESEGADLVAVASHRHGQIQRLMLGSVADDLARAAGSSLLVVPPIPS
jgi:nucleotide-binding universal stress UspA family protein